MGFFNNRSGIRGILQLLIIHLFCWLAWSVSFCLAQFGISEGVTGSVNNFPSLGITCVANLAVFVTTLIRGRLDLDMVARDVLAILGRKVNNINGMNGNGLTTWEWADHMGASVVMLSKGTPNSSITDFMKINAPIADSILLQFLPLRDAAVPIEACKCEGEGCRCIVFWTTESITVMLARHIPGTLKRLSDSQCLLPCFTCLKHGCHGCNDGLLHVETGEEGNRLREGSSIVKSPVEPHVVCKILEHIYALSIHPGKRICICIPMHGSRDDVWTKLLAKSLRSKSTGDTVAASEALEEYLAGGRDRTIGIVEYSIVSFIVPRLTEALINIVLTVFFTVDGFSSSLLARRTIKDYIVDSEGNGFAANAFLTKAVVMSDADNSCQLLTFRGDLLGFRTVSFIGGFVNMLCCIVWAVLIAFDGGPDSSLPPSIPTLALIMAAIGISFCMDFAMLLAALWKRGKGWKEYLVTGGIIFCPWALPCLADRDWRCDRYSIYLFLFLAMMHLEMICFVSGSIVAGTLGVKVFGKWIYAALQILVLFKWGVGCTILDFVGDNDFTGEYLGRTPATLLYLTYSSAFLLNAVLAGVRSKWGPWLWKDNHLWSRKLLH